MAERSDKSLELMLSVIASNCIVPAKTHTQLKENPSSPIIEPRAINQSPKLVLTIVMAHFELLAAYGILFLTAFT
jgi:hypothetical protein